MNLGQHAGFILIAYAAAAVILLVLIGWIALDHRVQRRALDEMEARGVTRRSGRQS
jgi:heme exporter protein D